MVTGEGRGGSQQQEKGVQEDEERGRKLEPVQTRAECPGAWAEEVAALGGGLEASPAKHIM